MSPLERLEWLRRVMDAPLTAAQVKLALALALRTNAQTGDCYPSKACLCADTGLSEYAVRCGVTALIQANLLAVKFSTGRATNRYQLTNGPSNPVPSNGVHSNPVPSNPVPRNPPTPFPATPLPRSQERGEQGKEQEDSLSGSRPTAGWMVPISEAEKLLDFLNAKAGTAFKVRTNNGKLTKGAEAARQRIAEHGLATMRRVVESKTSEWQGTDMAKFLRPETLFRKGNAENYAGQVDITFPQGKQPPPLAPVSGPAYRNSRDVLMEAGL